MALKSKKSKEAKPRKKGGKGGKFVVGAGILALLGLGVGWGFGLGTGDGDGKSDNTAVTEEADKQEVTEAETENIITIDITISGRDYLYQNSKISLEDLLTELNKYEKNAKICIKCDETATKNAVDDLTSALNDNKFTDVAVNQ